MDDIKRMDPKEFREHGYLQELNRRFLHPLGLAVEMEIDEKTGEEKLGGIWDYRDDPEGMIYAPGVIDHEKAKRVYAEQDAKERTRREKLGYVIQEI